jgi:hypothetical protein
VRRQARQQRAARSRSQLFCPPWGYDRMDRVPERDPPMLPSQAAAPNLMIVEDRNSWDVTQAAVISENQNGGR